MTPVSGSNPGTVATDEFNLLKCSRFVVLLLGPRIKGGSKECLFNRYQRYMSKSTDCDDDSEGILPQCNAIHDSTSIFGPLNFCVT